MVNLSILKDDFSSRANSSIFTSIEPFLLDWSNENSRVFPVLKSTSHFLPQSTVSCKSDLSSKIAISQIISSERLLMYSRKSVGPRMEPLGFPALTENSCEDFYAEPFKAVYY